MTRRFGGRHLIAPYCLLVVLPRLARESNRLPVPKAFGGCQLCRAAQVIPRPRDGPSPGLALLSAPAEGRLGCGFSWLRHLQIRAKSYKGSVQPTVTG